MDNGSRDTLEAVEEHVTKDKLPFTVVHDDKGVTAKKYGILGYPTAYLIGADGKVIWNGHPRPDIVKELEAKVEAAIAEAKEIALARAGNPPGSGDRPAAGRQTEQKPDKDDDEDEDEDD